MSTDEILYAHPAIAGHWTDLLKAIEQETGCTCRLLSVHRTPAKQLELFGKGRSWDGSRWTIVDALKVVTYKDGYRALSRHNELPAEAVDVGLFTAAGTYIPGGSAYDGVGRAAASFGLEWGGSWVSLKDLAHIQIFQAKLLGQSASREAALQWQRYLQKGGAYAGALDGYPGTNTLSALKALTGFTERSPDAWKALVDRFGPLT